MSKASQLLARMSSINESLKSLKSVKSIVESSEPKFKVGKYIVQKPYDDWNKGDSFEILKVKSTSSENIYKVKFGGADGGNTEWFEESEIDKIALKPIKSDSMINETRQNLQDLAKLTYKEDKEIIDEEILHACDTLLESNKSLDSQYAYDLVFNDGLLDAFCNHTKMGRAFALALEEGYGDDNENDYLASVWIDVLTNADKNKYAKIIEKIKYIKDHGL